MLPTEELRRRADAYREHGTLVKAAAALGIGKSALAESIKRAAEAGLLGTEPVLPGFRISRISNTPSGTFIQQAPERGERFELPAGHVVKGVSALVDANGRVIQQWQKTAVEAEGQLAAFQAMVDGLKEDLPRITIMPAPQHVEEDLLNQFVVTDSHFGMLAHREETGADYDLRLAEQLLLDWFAAAVAGAPQAHTAVLAQLGDLLHHDALESVTPAHKHVLDADSRLHKVVRVVIRTLRRVVDMLLQKHKHVHVVMASGNHDPASSVWVRELLATIYENEPRVTVDTSPMLYYAYKWGDTALFYHHGHKRGVAQVDATLAGMFREMFGASKYAFAHVGHLHSDEGRKSALMYVERHETLAAPDAYAAGGGWLSGRSAKVITYSRRYGEVARATLRPEMVAGRYSAANDNEPVKAAA
ncbi:oxidoreductase [Agrobacterium sp. S2/73]|uniref:oxidoreductase n=1 Tax=unclassified Agrobacterium TaxID=2632611 RepID=UPI001ADCEFE9|nr:MULTISPECIES: oxidoreductase [unclassified Agrobacterium]MBO9108875.1 oxidoreductase [Agrobacterium sp. S2/73]QXZ73374.1 oxidoreductase [Agrobacterium sp. S7/73]